MRKVRENLLVGTPGGMYPAGTPLFDVATGRVLVPNGTLVIYDESTGLSVGAGATPTSNATLVFAVGFKNPDGVMSLRKAFGDRIYNPDISNFTERAFKNGTPGIVDLKFSCTSCDTPYSFQVTWEDDRTQNVYPYNRPASETISVRTECCAGCDDCTDDSVCSEISTKIVAYVNGTLRGSNPGFDYKAAAAAARNRPYTAQLILPFAAEACIEVTNGEVTVAGVPTTLDSIDIGGVVIDVSGCTLGASTSVNDFLCIVDTVNMALAGPPQTGNIQIVGAPGGGYTVLVMSTTSSVTSGTISYGAGSQVACTLEYPALVAGDCGVRFASKDIELECGCFPPNPPVSYKARKLDIAIGEDWACGSASKTIYQESTEPDNLGYDWLWREYASDNGGIGRQQRPYNSMKGPLSLPITGDRSVAAMLSGIDCEAMYCSFSFEHTMSWNDTGIHGNLVKPRGRTVLLAESGSQTATDLGTFLSTWAPNYVADC